MPYPPIIVGMSARLPAPQRDRLRFFKAFFEVHDEQSVRDRLLGAGAVPLDAGLSESDGWFLWQESAPPPPTPRARFLLRQRGRRLVLEGPSAASVGRGWRELERRLGSAASARVAAGDDLGRFLPRQRRHSADRPESWSREYQNRVLAEFYSVFRSRWAATPHPRLEGRTPREAAEIPALRAALEALLERMEKVEAERVQRDLPAISVSDLRGDLGMGDASDSSEAE